MSARRRVLVVAAGLALIAGGIAIARLLPGTDAASSERAPQPAASTARVVRGNVSQQTVVAGALQFAGRGTVVAGLSGVVTGLPAVGAWIGFGRRLYSVDTQPVFLLRGRVPAWRDFARGMSRGPDIRQLEAGLRAMGDFRGRPDTAFGAATTAAIKRLQHASGRPRTGSLARGTILFRRSGVRVAQRRTTVGAQIGEGAAVLGISGRRKVVRADVKLGDQRLARRGTAVTVELPDGSSARGTVTEAGPPAEKRQAGTNSTAVVIPTTIGLRSQRRVRRFQRAPVSVLFAGRRRRDVLSVPVDALVALDDTTFAVEVPTSTGAPRRLAVRTGLYAAGRVEISGPGIRAGLTVIVPGP